MDKIYKNNRFEAVKLRFQDQAEQLYRMTMIDLRIFSGFITLQLAFGAWIATKGSELIGETGMKLGLGIIDFGLAFVAISLLRNNALRRQEVIATVKNCAQALGFKEPGEFIENEPLDVKYELRLWKNYYYFGVAISFVGFILVLVSAS